jgi:hypothetical protein
MTGTHPPRDSPEWETPDRCPFCGAALSDGGGGFMDHVEDAEACSDRFDAWLERIRDDIGGEWGG